MRFLKVLSALKQKVLGAKLKLVNKELIGRKFIVYNGTINNADMDDAWLYALAKHHNVIYDVGCNMGLATILASIDDADKKVVLIDPNPDALECAAGSLMRNNMSLNKMYVPAFVSDKSGEKVKFYSAGVATAGSMFSGHSETIKAINAYYWVDTLTLDDISARTGVFPDLVKLDVEGAENFAMEGAVKIAAAQKTTFFIEMHSPPEMPMQQNTEKMLAWCRKAGYDAFYLKEHCPLTDAQMVAHRGRCHILLLPGGMPYPSYLKDIKQGAEVADAVRILKGKTVSA